MILVEKVKEFKHTRKALKRYNSLQASRDMFVTNTKTNADVDQWYKMCADDVDEVREAFFMDTADINSWEHCAIVSIEYIQTLLT
jgi:hypothetical protein